jgi:hypothetical protein
MVHEAVIGPRMTRHGVEFLLFRNPAIVPVSLRQLDFKCGVHYGVHFLGISTICLWLYSILDLRRFFQFLNPIHSL